MSHGKLISTEVIFSKFGKKFVKEDLLMPDGNKLDWYYLDTPKSSIIVPITPDNEFVMIRQYRHNLKKYVIEFPAGGDNPQTELLEETGYSSSNIELLGKYYTLPSETNRWVSIYLAKNVTKIQEPKLDDVIEKYFDISVILKNFKNKLELESLEHCFALELAKNRLK